MGSDRTQNTTAKITLQHSLTYQKLTEDFGPQRAASTPGQPAGHPRLLAIAKRLKISCQLEEVPAYLYTRNTPRDWRKRPRPRKIWALVPPWSGRPVCPSRWRGSPVLSPPGSVPPLHFSERWRNH